MELADWFLVVTFVAVGLGSVASASRFFRGGMDVVMFGATATVLIGLALAAIVRFVDGPRELMWTGIAFTWLGFAALNRNRRSGGVASGSDSPSSGAS